jgi:hypothetical protein
MSVGKTRQHSAKKRSLWVINEHVEPNINAGWPSAIVFQHPVKASRTFARTTLNRIADPRLLSFVIGLPTDIPGHLPTVPKNPKVTLSLIIVN